MLHEVKVKEMGMSDVGGHDSYLQVSIKLNWGGPRNYNKQYEDISKATVRLLSEKASNN